MKTYKEFLEETQQFYGTTQWMRFSALSRLTITDGIKYTVDKYQCYWILDIIASYQSKYTKYDLQVWEIEVDEHQCSALIVGRDGDLNEVVSQAIPFTDLELEKVVLWCQNGTIFLPSEY